MEEVNQCLVQPLDGPKAKPLCSKERLGGAVWQTSPGRKRFSGYFCLPLFALLPFFRGICKKLVMGYFLLIL
jgi:hypothetical protein